MNQQSSGSQSVSKVSPVHTLRFREKPGCSLADYLKAVAFVVGAKEITGIFRINGKIKVNLKSEQAVSKLRNEKINLPSYDEQCNEMIKAKIIFPSVDPVISDDDLRQLISSYGTVTSEIEHVKVSDDIKYSHVIGPQRYVYMQLSCLSSFPPLLTWHVNDEWYTIPILIEEVYEKSDNSECERKAVNEPELIDLENEPLLSDSEVITSIDTPCGITEGINTSDVIKIIPETTCHDSYTFKSSTSEKKTVLPASVRKRRAKTIPVGHEKLNLAKMRNSKKSCALLLKRKSLKFAYRKSCNAVSKLHNYAAIKEFKKKSKSSLYKSTNKKHNDNKVKATSIMPRECEMNELSSDSVCDADFAVRKLSACDGTEDLALKKHGVPFQSVSESTSHMSSVTQSSVTDYTETNVARESKASNAGPGSQLESSERNSGESVEPSIRISGSIRSWQVNEGESTYSTFVYDVPYSADEHSVGLVNEIIETSTGGSVELILRMKDNVPGV